MRIFSILHVQVQLCEKRDKTWQNHQNEHENEDGQQSQRWQSEKLEMTKVILQVQEVYKFSPCVKFGKVTSLVVQNHKVVSFGPWRIILEDFTTKTLHESRNVKISPLEYFWKSAELVLEISEIYIFGPYNKNIETGSL